MKLLNTIHEDVKDDFLCSYTQLQNITVAELVIKYLELEGVTHVFGIPGGYISPFLDILRRHPTIKLIISRHEEGAVFMADGYARQSGKLGVVFTTAGPGATNALTGIACAKADRVPLMLIVGQPSTGTFGLKPWQDSSCAEINLSGIYRNICGFSEMAVDPNNFPFFFSRALKVAFGIPHQPVHISLPINISSSIIQKVDFPLRQNYRFLNQMHANISEMQCRNQLKKIADVFMTASNPVFFIGSGSESALRNPTILSLFVNFISTYKIPVVTSPKAKGLFPETETMSLGVFGLGGSKQSTLYLEQFPPDVLIILGSSLNEWASQQYDKRLIPTKTLVQVDIDPISIGRVYPVNYGVVMNIELFISSFIETIHEKIVGLNTFGMQSEKISERLRKFELFKGQTEKFVDPEKMHSTQLPLKPQKLFAELAAFYSSYENEVTFFLDIGNSTGFFSHYMQLSKGARFYSAYGFTCMGWTAGACIGAKLASPNLNGIAIMGDGAFLMNGVEIQTAARYQIGVVYIVLFDNQYGMVHHGEKASSAYPVPEDGFYSLGSPDLIKFAESLGAETTLIDSPDQLTKALTSAVQSASTHKKPQVLIAKVDSRECAPFSERFKSIAKQKRLLKEKSDYEYTQ